MSAEPGALTAEQQAELDQQEAELTAAKRAEILAQLPEGLTLDDNGDIVPDTENGWVGCPLCIGKGYLKEEYPQSEAYKQCPDCRGHGETGTGSLVPGKQTMMCPTCSSNGYLLTEAYDELMERRRAAEQEPAPAA